MSNSDPNKIEETTAFTPKFNDDGLIPCITQDANTGQVLMMAWMNQTALTQTLKTGEAHYWSRSRNELWHKGATSGATQKLITLKTDCDQDCLLMQVEITPQTQNQTCHTNRTSCFYRTIEKDGNETTLQHIKNDTTDNK